VLVVKGKENPSSKFDLLEVVEVTPRAKVEYPADMLGGELGPCNDGEALSLTTRKPAAVSAAGSDRDRRPHKSGPSREKPPGYFGGLSLWTQYSFRS
jgi:hypothetical protein